MERIPGILSDVVTDSGYLCAARGSEVVLLLLLESVQGFAAAQGGDGLTFTCPFSFCAGCLDMALPADCCAHLFPDPKEDSQLFSTGCGFCWIGSQRGLVRARACTSKWQQHMSGRGSKSSPFLAVVSC